MLSDWKSPFVIEISVSPASWHEKKTCPFVWLQTKKATVFLHCEKNTEQENSAETFQTISFTLCSAITFIVSGSKEACTIQKYLELTACFPNTGSSEGLLSSHLVTQAIKFLRGSL